MNVKRKVEKIVAGVLKEVAADVHPSVSQYPRGMSGKKIMWHDGDGRYRPGKIVSDPHPKSNQFRGPNYLVSNGYMNFRVHADNIKFPDVKNSRK